MSNHNERMTLGKGGLPGEAKNHALCLGAVIVARVTGGGYPAGVGWSPHSEATARRLAACWNACAGIPTEAIEQGAIAEALALLSDAIASLHDEENPDNDAFLNYASPFLAKLKA